MPYEIFISYSRKDNEPQKPGDTEGWVTALRDEILADHRRFSTEPLKIFFDQDDIQTLDDWRHKILTGLRESKILLVCLSPNYFTSPPCLWEWEEYDRRQVHNLIGHDGIAPIYFVESPNSDEQLNAAWLEAVTRNVVTDAIRPDWEKRWRAWYSAVDRPDRVDLKPWYPDGVAALREAAVRERLEKLGSSLWERVQRIRRAEGATGKIPRMNPHFVGRSSELAELHEKLAHGAIGVVTALNGLGGQGKTELAIAYAHSWADHYPAGVWLVRAEDKKELLPLLGELSTDLGVEVGDDTGEARGKRVLGELERRAKAASEKHPDAAVLVILDNVSEPGLLSDPQLKNLPAEPWLRVIATTREAPDEFSGTTRQQLDFVAVDKLTEADGAALLEWHQVRADGKWPAATAEQDRAAAHEIARELDGFTLAVEAVAIYLGLHPEIRPADYFVRLHAAGLRTTDDLPHEDPKVNRAIRHREKQLAIVLDQTLARLSPPEITALEFACLLPPDSIPWPWLRDLVTTEYPEIAVVELGRPDPWLGIRRRLEGLRLLTLGDHPEVARMHRMLSARLADLVAITARRAKVAAIDIVLDQLQIKLEAEAPNSSALLWQLRPLQEAILHLDLPRDSDLRHARRAGVVGAIELRFGRLDRAFTFLDLSAKIAEAAIGVDRQDSVAANALAVALTDLGDLFSLRGQSGDAARALGSYERSLQIREHLLDSNPTSVLRQTRVCVSLNRLGDFLSRRGQQGDADRALGCYERCAEILERHLLTHPDTDTALFGLSVGLEKLGVFLRHRGQPGDAVRALGYFERCLELREGLMRDNPTSAQMAEAVAAIFEKLGDFYDDRDQPGDAEQALDYRERSLETREQLLREHAWLADLDRGVAVSLVKFGTALWRRGQPGDAAKALECYERSLDIRERLLRANQTSGRAARDVSIGLSSLADFLASQGSPGEATRVLRWYERACNIAQELLDHNPESAEAARELSVLLNKLGVFLSTRGQPGDTARAFGYFERSQENLESVLRGNPASAQAARDVLVSHIKLAQFGSAIGDTGLLGRHQRACYDLLHRWISRGVKFDPTLMELYARLRSTYGR